MTSKSREYPDPMEKRLDPDRVNYANGVLLDKNDFRDEQTYFRGRLGRALTCLHGMGTVAGLKVKEETIQYIDNGVPKEEPVIRVEPGLAIDRIGRLIELPTAYCIRAQQWFEAQDPDQLSESFANSIDAENLEQAVVADLFISFNNCGRGNTPYFGVSNVDATDAFTADRLRDSACLQLILRPNSQNKDTTQKLPYEELVTDNTGLPLTFEAAVNRIRDFKLEEGWKKLDFWNKDSNNLEYTDEQNGTEIFLARVRLPATIDPDNNDLLKYDTQGAISDPDDTNRVLSYSAFELSWLIQATEK